MLVRKGPLTKDDLCLFLNDNMAKIVQNIADRNGSLQSFELNFNFENSQYRLTEKDIRSFRTRQEN
jgi:hypothetical protein